MAKVVHITSHAQLDGILASSKVVLADFSAKWCGPCQVVKPIFERIAEDISNETNVVTFVEIDTDAQKEIAQLYRVTALPTFVLFRDGKVLDRVQGANLKALEALMTRVGREVTSALESAAGSGTGSGSTAGAAASSATWSGAGLPRGYHDITDQVEATRLELLNVDPDGGGVRVLFGKTKPSGRTTGTDKDWIESDTDEQLMLFVPFQSMVKLHTLQITSLPKEEAARPLLIKLYSNTPHNLGFDEAEDTVATQEIELKPSDWNDQNTASIGLRFVKFQNLSSLVVFVVSAEDGSEKVRLDRIRLIGEAGEKREMGKLEKIGDEQGE